MPTLGHRLQVLGNLVKATGAVWPPHQITATAGSDAYVHLSCSPAPPTTSLNSGNTINFDIERDTIKLIDDIIIRFRVSCSSADVETLPVHYWCNRLIVEAERGSADELIHIYPENFIIWDYLTENRVNRETSQYYSNYYSTPYKSENAEKYWIRENNKFKAGETRDVYLKIPALFFHLKAIDMTHVRSDLRLRLELSNDIIVSGSASNLSLDSLDLVCQNFAEEDFDRNFRTKMLLTEPHKYMYCDCERYQVSDKTLNAGATTKIELDQFTGKMGFAVVVIKPSTTPAASDKSKINFVEIGQEGTMDITNPNSQSLLGQGTALKEGHLYQIFSQQTNNPHVKGMYIIPFSENVKKALAGSMATGFREFVGLRDYLELTFDSAPTQEVQTISLGTTASSGTYRYGFEKCGLSDQELDYDDGASDIQTAINAMPELLDRNISVTVNDGIDAVTSQTITFNANSGKVSDELGKITILGNGTPKVNSTSVTTTGRRGFTSGSNYQVNVYMYKFKCLNVDKNGRLSCHDV